MFQKSRKVVFDKSLSQAGQKNRHKRDAKHAYQVVFLAQICDEAKNANTQVA